MANLSTSKGNQMKWRGEGTFHKLDLLGGDAVAEFLVSALLEFSNFPIPYVTYRVGGRGVSESISEDFSPVLTFISFYRTLEIIFPQYSWYKSEYTVERCFEVWEAREWNPLSAIERVELVANIFSTTYNIPYEGIRLYLSSLITLDSLILNTDRHFNNFGVMLNKYTGKYLPSWVFDNGYSLGVGSSDFNQAINLRKVKMVPYVTSWSKFQRLSNVTLIFDAKNFVHILSTEFPYGLQFLNMSMQWKVLRHQLCKLVEVDKNGIVLDDYFNSVGL